MTRGIELVIVSLTIYRLCLGGDVLAQPIDRPRLAALTVTSGGNAEVLLDDNDSTEWRPFGDARNEGVLFRFENIQKTTGISFSACGANQDGSRYNVYLNGNMVSDKGGFKSGRYHYRFRKRGIRSLYIELASRHDCLREVTFFGGDGNKIQVQPPRQVSATVTASSTLLPKNAYHPNYLFDGRLDFGWVEGASGLGIGESITMSFDRPVTFKAIEIWNGYQRSQDHFWKNARAKHVLLAVDSNEVKLKLKNKSGAQRLRLPQQMTGTQVKMTVLKAFRGKTYPDLVISEMRFYDANGPFGIVVKGDEGRAKLFRTLAKGSSLEKIIDKPWYELCELKKNQPRSTLKLRSNHSFVLYKSTKDVRTVTDGAWVALQTGTEKLKTKIFGRRHRVSMQWAPYGKKRKYSSTTVTGGTLTFRFLAAMTSTERKRHLKKILKLRRKNSCRSRLNNKKLDQLAEEGAVIVQGRIATGVFSPAP